MERRWLALIVVVLVVLLVAPIILLMLAGAAPTAVDQASSPEESAGEPEARLDAEHMSWSFATLVWENDGGMVPRYGLQAGTLAAEGPIVDFEVPYVSRPGDDAVRSPAVSAPVHGGVFYVADDGARSQVRRVTIEANPVDEIIAEIDQIVWDLAVDPAGTFAYLAVIERDGTDAGVLSLPADGSGPPRRVMEPARAAVAPAEVRQAAVVPFDMWLETALDGRHLMRISCTALGCATDVLNVASGAVVELGERDPIGALGDMMILRSCGVRSCSAHTLDLGTGEERDLGPLDRTTVLVNDGGRPIPVAEGDLEPNGNAIDIVAIDVGAGEERELIRAPAGSAVSLVSNQLIVDIQITVPDGVALVDLWTPLDTGRVAIDVETGERIDVLVPPIRMDLGGINQG